MNEPETKSTARAAPYIAMLRHWVGMVAGKSYWHQRQGLGQRFVPNRVAGYFNDLTAKTNWSGPTDADGLPLNTIFGATCYFPTSIFQKGLGHWDEWLNSSGVSKQAHWNHIVKCGRWILHNQDDRGGWALPDCGLSFVSPYSAMVQGEAASLCVRLYTVTHEPAYLDAARRAINLMVTPIEEGGTARATDSGLILEEFVTPNPGTVLNGWIFALFGLHDLQLIAPTHQLSTWLNSTLNALQLALNRYDAGYWSFYALTGALASPFYHQLHIAQLHALDMISNSRTGFGEMATRFEGYAHSRARSTRAVVMKAVQKLKNPPPAVLR